MHYLDIAKVIRDMDAPEADATGVSCRSFTRTLIEEFNKLLLREQRDFFTKAAMWDEAHHLWCNYGIGPVEDCSMCERLYRKFPIKEGQTADDMMEEHFPDTTWRDFKIVDHGRVVFGRASKRIYKSKH